jgi:ABC-type Zn uptake system ZnuABC Zn-binding protein ZnuA
MRRLVPRLAGRAVLVVMGLGLMLFWAWGPGTRPAAGADRIRVVTSTTDLKALAQAVGGDLVEVDSLARGNQNPHDLEVRPSQMVKLRRADLVVLNGLELDGWAEVSIQGANNPRIIPGASGRVDASIGIPVLEVPTGKVDRSMGDVHPVGNPHYTLDPGMATIITANIVEGLARVAPEQRGAFEQARQVFLTKLEPAMAEWARTMAPFKGPSWWWITASGPTSSPAMASCWPGRSAAMTCAGQRSSNMEATAALPRQISRSSRRSSGGPSVSGPWSTRPGTPSGSWPTRRMAA